MNKKNKKKYYIFNKLQKIIILNNNHFIIKYTLKMNFYQKNVLLLSLFFV